jgi:hypothetical protein
MKAGSQPRRLGAVVPGTHRDASAIQRRADVSGRLGAADSALGGAQLAANAAAANLPIELRLIDGGALL